MVADCTLCVFCVHSIFIALVLVCDFVEKIASEAWKINGPPSFKKLWRDWSLKIEEEVSVQFSPPFIAGKIGLVNICSLFVYLPHYYCFKLLFIGG